MDYEEKILLKLRREYSKDEAVSLAMQKLSEVRIEVGILRSENAELQDKLNSAMVELKTLREYKATQKQARRGQALKFAEMKRDLDMWRDKYLTLKNR